jgi:hypothetical protein
VIREKRTACSSAYSIAILTGIMVDKVRATAKISHTNLYLLFLKILLMAIAPLTEGIAQIF